MSRGVADRPQARASGGHQYPAAKRGEVSAPRLLLIADGFAAGRAGLDAADVQERVADLVATGLRWVQLRDHRADASVIATQVGRSVDRLRSIDPGVRIAVNTHVEVARTLGTDLHVGRRGPTLSEARVALPDALLSAAVHSVEEARAAVQSGADVLLFSPVFPTSSKPGQRPAELDALAQVCQVAAPVPVLALGGITPERAGACRSAGAFGVAVLSGLLGAEHPEAALAAYLEALHPPDA